MTTVKLRGSIPFMTSYDIAAWSVVLSLSLMMVGGLTLWAYGARRQEPPPSGFAGPEAESARLFHVRLARWFFVYGISVILVGTAMLLWASSILF